MALPALNHPVSYPDPLREIPTVDTPSINPEAPVSEATELLEYGTHETAMGLEDEEGDEGNTNRSHHHLPTVVSLKEFGRPPAPGTIKPSWLDTSYQKAIARVRERIVVQRNHPRNAEEWRYPKAPVPARPDLTQKFPVFIGNDVKDSFKRRNKHRRSWTYPQAATVSIRKIISFSYF